MNNLEKFHLKCKKEYNEIIKEFNILFYGYGCKENILSKLFPNTRILNCYFMNRNEICQEILNIVKKLKIETKGYEQLKYPEILDKINETLKIKEEYIKIIIINFDFENLDGFINKDNIKIIGTLENIKTKLTFDHIINYKFIFRDLTTYEPYFNEIGNIKLEGKIRNTQNIINVLNSVSKKSRNIFKLLLTEFLESDIISLKDLFQMVKKKFLINNYGIFSNLLLEFFDHKFLKRVECENILINLSIENRKELLENWEYE